MTPGWERHARGNGGGFAPLEASCRRVAGVSWLYWCNSPRLVAVSLESRPRPGPPALSDPSGERRIFDDGGFCTTRSLTTACRRRVAPLMLQFPRLVAVRPRFRAVRSRFRAAWRPKCRPPRRQTPTMGDRGRGGLRFGQNCLGHGVSLAREPLKVRGNPLICTSTSRYAHGRRAASGGVGHVAANLSICAWAALPTCISSGPRARCRAQARMSGPACARVHEGKPPGGQAAAKRARVRVASARSKQFRMQFD